MNRLEIMHNLLGHGLNELILAGKVDMNSTESVGKGFVDAKIEGENARVVFTDIGHGEFSMTVIINYDYTSYSCANSPVPRGCVGSKKSKVVADAVVNCWVERKTGKWLQIDKSHKPYSSYLSNESQSKLSSMKKCKPIDFSMTGKFFL